ncbi:alcohol oxidase [Mycena rebaudengoi]|nr:alcohol oxidase [Mycena rebaudengoi]
MAPRRFWVAFCLQYTLSLATIIPQATDLASSSLTFDYIIVGGGTAGNTLANRLSENEDHSVLVLEAGGSDEGVLNTQVPFFAPRASPNTPQDWNYTTTPQSGLDGRSVPYPRGFVLGGSSSINFMVYTRGTKDDFNRFASVSGDEGWSWNSLIPYMRKNERFSPPVDHSNISRQFNPAVHGFDGINTVSLPAFPRGTDALIIQTTSDLRDEFPFNLDMNSGDHLGIGWTQSTIKNGTRSSSATSYLAPKYLNRRNLHVMLNTRATRVLRSDAGSRNPEFRTVEFSPSTGGTVRYRITARKELILSAGSIGIGDSASLSSLGITPVHDLSSVGQNLIDHPFLRFSWLVNSTDTFDNANPSRNATLAAEQLDLWKTTRSGPLVDSTTSQLGWLRVPKNSPIFERFEDPSAGPHSCPFRINFRGRILAASHRFPVSVQTRVYPYRMSDTASGPGGSVTLNSSNPFDPPLINPNLLGSELDLLIFREGVRSAQRFVEGPVWKNYIISPFTINSTASDAELDDFIRGHAGSLFHPVGTASMSRKGAKRGVVDPDLTVKGLSRLRIVDASVLPFIPTGHTQAAVYIFAERAADLIKHAT